MCTSILDGLNGQAPHVTQRANFAVVARSPIQRIREFARGRGWTNLRLLSSAGNAYTRDYHGETPDGGQMPMLNVFTRRGGKAHHSYGTELLYAPTEPGRDPCHVDLVWPLWNMFDSTLESFTGRTPNEIIGPEVTHLPFVITDPLPMVRGGVNGPDTLYFLIDTGGAELIIDTAVASAAGAVVLGQGTGVFAGGTAPVADGRVDSVRLGEFVMRNVPVRIMDIRKTSPAVAGQRVDGVIGTVVLYHFLATIDYLRGELVLRRRSPAMLVQVEREAAAASAVALPFWLASDHFMFAWGSVNGRPPVLLFVDTGLAGGGFVCSEEAARSYGIDLTKTSTSEGVSGAGRTRTTWFAVDSLSMGPVTTRNVRGAVGTLAFRQSFGFDAGGIISHQFFREHALTFDFEGMRMFLTPEP